MDLFFIDAFALGGRLKRKPVDQTPANTRPVGEVKTSEIEGAECGLA
jgi:hypothetical protein